MMYRATLSLTLFNQTNTGFVQMIDSDSSRHGDSFPAGDSDFLIVQSVCVPVSNRKPAQRERGKEGLGLI